MFPTNAMKGAAQKDRTLWSVTALNNAIKDSLHANPLFRNLWIEAELLNVVYHHSGHIYFTLKDKDSMMRATFFRNANAAYRHIRLQSGMKVELKGSVSVYPKNGAYQFNVQKVLLAGEGRLRQEIEERRQRLFAEGLFDASRKKPLPYYPVTLGIATAPTGAAIQDIIRVAQNRNPRINLLLAPCRVQGEGAAESIAGAIEALNDPSLQVDVIIAGRGGGSFEDLLPFNEEAVVRAFADSRIPIVAAVGHEIDRSLSDLAADHSAPTPSAAAEQAVPIYDEFYEYIIECGLRLDIALRNRYAREQERLSRILTSRVYEEPTSLFEPHALLLDQTTSRLELAQSHIVERKRASFEHQVEFFPVYYRQNIEGKLRRFSLLAERLSNFSPLGTLRRGYSIVRDSSGRVIRKASKVQKDDKLEVLLSEGSLAVQVLECHQEYP